MQWIFTMTVTFILFSSLPIFSSYASDADLKEIKAMLVELNKKVDSLEKRIIRLEEGQKALNKRVDDLNKRIDTLETSLNKRIDDVNTSLSKRIDDVNNNLSKRIDDLWNLTITGFAILFAGMFTLIGFVIWDRRTAISPVQNEVRELKEEFFELKKSLREYAKKEPKFAEVFKSFL